MKDNILVAYFMQKGVETSTSKQVADDIANALFEKEYTSIEYAITPVEQYPIDDKALFEKVTKLEKDHRIRPTLTNKVGKFHDYRTIVIVAPNWYNDLPMAVYSFLDDYDFSGKRIVPVICHAGDGSKEIVNSLRNYVHNCDVMEPVDVDDRALDSKAVAQAVKETLAK